MFALKQFLTEHPHVQVTLSYCPCDSKVVYVRMVNVTYTDDTEEKGIITDAEKKILEEEFDDEKLYEVLMYLWDESKRREIKLSTGEVEPDFAVVNGCRMSIEDYNELKDAALEAGEDWNEDDIAEPTDLDYDDEPWEIDGDEDDHRGE